MKDFSKNEYLLGFATKDEVLEQIRCIGYDYDGFRTIEGLKSLIDELVELADYGLHLER